MLTDVIWSVDAAGSSNTETVIKVKVNEIVQVLLN